MATVVDVKCAACNREQSIPATAITLAVYETGPRYGFRCPTCREQISKPASPQTLKLLTAAGVTARVHMRRPTIDGRTPAGPPLTEDDLINFGRQLEATPNALAS